MNCNHENINRFLALSDLYFRLTGKSCGEMSGAEMEEFYALTTQCSEPDRFHKIVARKMNIKRGSMEKMEYAHAHEWSMLPPEQRII